MCKIIELTASVLKAKVLDIVNGHKFAIAMQVNCI